jgi:transposase
VPYSEKFKLRMIERLSAPNAPSASTLSREVGVPQSTLSLWLRRARSLPRMSREQDQDPRSSKARNPSSWSAEEKYQVVLEAVSLSDAELGEFLRRKGLHAVQLEEWRAIVAAAAKTALTRGGKGGRSKSKGDPRRIRELERELRRKEKALAEMAALIALKKKLDLLWGDEDESTTRRNG